MRRRRRARDRPGWLRALAPIAGSLFTVAAAVGQEPGPIVTDRPDQTESAESVPSGSFQLELGWTYAQDREDGIEVRTHSVPAALLRVGLGSGLEARFGFAGWISQEQNGSDPLLDRSFDESAVGTGDADLGFKWQIAELESAGTRVALLGSVSLPIGDQGLGSERADPAFRLAISNELSDRVSLGYNAGVQWETIDGSPDAAVRTLDTQADLLYTVAIGFGLTDRLGAFLEGFGLLGLIEDRPDRHNLDGGFTLLLSDTIQLDASAGLGLNAAADDWFVSAGVSSRFPR